MSNKVRFLFLVLGCALWSVGLAQSASAQSAVALPSGGFSSPGGGVAALPVPFVGVTVPIAALEARAPRYAYLFMGSEPDPALIAVLRASVRRGSIVQLFCGSASTGNAAFRKLAAEFPTYALRGELRSDTLITDFAVYIGGLRGREAGRVVTDPGLLGWYTRSLEAGLGTAQRLR